MPGSAIIPCLTGEVNGRRRIHGAACSANRYSRQDISEVSSARAPCGKIPDLMNSPSHSNGTSAEASFRQLLLAWYDAHARDLPWRKDRDPLPGLAIGNHAAADARGGRASNTTGYFCGDFPTVENLRRRRESWVLAAWSGLGYYRRARMLHAASKVIVPRVWGEISRTRRGPASFPGIGRYTSAAIASIAFSEPVAVVDGNVERVLHRFSGKRVAPEQFGKRPRFCWIANGPAISIRP